MWRRPAGNRRAPRSARGRHAMVCLVGLAIGTGGCASLPTTGPGIDDLTFRLSWMGSADLDLYVRTPTGDEVSSEHPNPSTGAAVSADCNPTPEQMCAEPLEDVRWPRGAAPHGTYQFSVRMVNLHDSTFPIPFAVQVVEGSRIVATHRGVIGDFRQTGGPWEIILERSSQRRARATRRDS